MAETISTEAEVVKKPKVPQLFTVSPYLDGILSKLDASSSSRFTVSKADIQSAIENNNVDRLRNYSQYFFHASGEYRRLVEYFANLLTFNFVVIPQVDAEAVKLPRFEKAFQNVLNYTKYSHVEEVGRIIAATVIKDGAFYGYERDDVDVYVLQKLPTAYCRSRFKIDGIYAIEFDFSFFAQFRNKTDLEEALAAFPEEFAAMYNSYLKDTKNLRWQFIDPTKARAHMLTDEVPLLAPIFLDLIEFEDYKQIDKMRSKLDVYKVVIQKIPLDENGEITMELDDIKMIHNNAKDMLGSSMVKVLTTPTEVHALDVKDTKAIAQDDVEKAQKILYGSAGTPMVLFSSGAKTGSVGLERSLQVDESLMYQLLDQFKTWYELRFKTLVGQNKKFSFGIMFPPITVFNRKDMATLYMNASSQGYPTRLLAMVTLGIHQTDVDALLRYENELLELPIRMIPTQSSYTLGGEDEEGGRPESDGPLTDEGDATKDGDKNKNQQ